MKKIIYILLFLFPAVVSAQVYNLEQCTEMALKHNYDLKNSHLDFDMADQTKKEAFTNYFPTVSAIGMAMDANKHFIDENVDLSMLGKVFAGMGIDPATLGIPSSYPIKMMKDGVLGMVTAIQPIFTGGQIYYGNKLAKTGRDISSLQINLSENDVIAKTEEYFWQIVALKEKLNTLSAVDTQLIEIHRTVSASVNAGVTTRNNLLKVELQQQNIASSRIKVENGIKVYKLLLSFQTGVAKDSFDINVSHFPEVKNPVEYFMNPDDGLKQRTENKMLDKGVEAAALQRKMAIGKNMPMVAAGAGYMYHNLLDKDVDMGLVFATVSVPISSWWGGSHEIKKQKLNEMKAENQRLKMRDMMTVEIESKWNDLQESYLQTQIAQKSIESSTENLRLNKDYFNAGTVSVTDLLDAQTMLQQSHDQYTDACTTYYLKLTAYLQATGRNETGKK